jgi:signal transduction histidine kinase
MAAQEKVNILLVDDQPSRLLSYEAILEELNQNLVKVTSGVEALERLMRDDFAVILLDVSMPGMDGFETASLIHQHPRFEKTPIIFVTALHVTDMDRMTGYALGAVDYVYVPVVPEILRSKVSVLVELHQKRRELQRANLELAAANSTLQAEKTRELEALNQTLALANVELARANQTLQQEMAARARLEEALRETDRRKDEFLAILAHELRNPLAPITNALQLMRFRRFDDQELIWCRDVIGRQIEYLTRLVEDLLDVSRITQGKIKLQREPVELSSVVTRAIETMRPLIEARRHVLTVELPNQSVRIDGDATRLAQVVGNLLNNAIKYTEDMGRISVVAGLEQDPDGTAQAFVRVRDSGVGIPDGMLPRVFDLFTQVERTLDRAQGGLGIGLALVQRLVEMHGGTVEAFSEGEGKGSEFAVRLPVLAASPREPTEQERPETRRGTQFRRVLVADDNVDSAMTLATLLRINGNEVETAHDGEEAWQVAERIRPDLVLLDLGMPKLDGCCVAKRIRQEPWGRSLLMIALTGWGQEEMRLRTEEAGFDAHLVKPVDFAVLTRILSDRASAESLVDS